MLLPVLILIFFLKKIQAYCDHQSLSKQPKFLNPNLGSEIEPCTKKFAELKRMLHPNTDI